MQLPRSGSHSKFRNFSDTLEFTVKKIALAVSMLALAATSACVIPQSEECGKYIDCQAHFDEVNELTSTDLSESYGEGGTCWQNADTADSCTSACESANTSLKDSLDAAGEDLGPCA